MGGPGDDGGRLRRHVQRKAKAWMAPLTEAELATFIGLLQRIQDSVEGSDPARA